MEVSLAIKIVNECLAFKKLNGEFPVSKYTVINRYRKLAFSIVKDITDKQRGPCIVYEDLEPMPILKSLKRKGDIESPKRKEKTKRVTFNKILDYEPTEMGSYGGFTGPVDL